MKPKTLPEPAARYIHLAADLRDVAPRFVGGNFGYIGTSCGRVTNGSEFQTVTDRDADRVSCPGCRPAAIEALNARTALLAGYGRVGIVNDRVELVGAQRTPRNDILDPDLAIYEPIQVPEGDYDLKDHPLYGRLVHGRYGTYVWQDLRELFDQVSDPAQWRDPIDVNVDADKALTVADAILFCSGSVPTVEPLADGRFRIQATGFGAAYA